MGTRVRPPSMLCLIYFSALLSLGLAQSIGFGKCPKVTVQENFDVNQYTGRWYEIQRIPVIYQKGQYRVTATYTSKSNGLIEVVNAGKGSDGKPVSITGEAKCDNTGKMWSSFLCSTTFWRLLGSGY